MSEYDDDNWSPEELKEMFGEPEEGELFDMSVVNTRTMQRTKAEFRNTANEVVPVKEVASKLIEYMDNKLRDSDGNQFTDEIMPLMSQLLGYGLPKLMGNQGAALYLTSYDARHALAYMMCLSFLTLKFIESKELKIHTTSEPVSEEELTKWNTRPTHTPAMDENFIEDVLGTAVEKGVIPTDILERILEKNKK